MYNLGLSQVLALILLTTSENELDYYQQKVNVQVASRVAEQLKTSGFRKLVNCERISYML